ncbi:ATP-binding protein [Bacilliculturomica massiliensis]|uniref:ATP-binding protein n=1 Tax=Bacilliculturomica massiliensis TaxID=1917867 RepID=UPI001FEAC3B4|nr:ATP-binding protein [Bacilliculturomica massiliensis]
MFDMQNDEVLKIQHLKIQLRCMTIFRELLERPVLRRFLELADRLQPAGRGADRDPDQADRACAATWGGDQAGTLEAGGTVSSEGTAGCGGGAPARSALAAAAEAYAAFVSELYAVSDDLSDHIRELVLADENPYILKSCAADLSGSPMKDSLYRDLQALQRLCSLRPENVREAVCACFFNGDPRSRKAVDELFSAGWNTSVCDLRALYEERLAGLFTRGYGMFAKYHTFVVNDGEIVPVKYPDPQTLAQLADYERERAQVIKNTQALLKGEPASNVLLYGDAGTGKSSTIKAIANEYRDQGLRLIEVKKNQLYQIPELLETISRNPLKFILFIDDLSFSSNDNDFAALKAILEGSVTGRSGNLAVYATSNRRHLVKETMSGREGDEIHLNDTMQELMSLSARFGLVVTFSKPGKDVYLNIVRHLADEYGVKQDEEKLFQKAEAFAIRSGGRSPRVAKQFIELVKADIR